MIYSREELLPKKNKENNEDVLQKSIGNYLTITLLIMPLLYFIMKIFWNITFNCYKIQKPVTTLRNKIQEKLKAY